MSEYQYYEFQAIDLPLTQQEMCTLRTYSTRATITPTLFTNHYDWGSFKGDPAAWMEKYFDAFFYFFSNWHTYELMFRLPHGVLALDVAKPYCRGETARARVNGDFTILEFPSEDEAGGDGSDDGTGWLSSLIPLRADLEAGDYRILYLACLRSAQIGELYDDVPELPVPPDLGALSGSLKSFNDFLRLDPDLLAVAAVASAPQAEPPAESKIALWVTALSEWEKTAWVLRLARGHETHLRMEPLKTFRDSQAPVAPLPGPSRTVRELLSASEQHTEAHGRREAENAARKRQHRGQEAAAVRWKYLAILAKRVPETWQEIDALIATKRPGNYDTAVQLLKDLAELGMMHGRQAEVREHLERLRAEHARKPTLIKRMREAGLLT